MKPEPVFVLCSCRNEELWPLSTLFLKTIRIGFPNAQINVVNNCLSRERSNDLEHLTRDIGGKLSLCIYPMVHHQWIATRISLSAIPFWICDTDVVFHGKIEGSKPSTDAAIWAQTSPKFVCPYTGFKTHSRPHTALMRIDPKKLLSDYEVFHLKLPVTPFGFDGAHLGQLISPSLETHDGQLYFHDTMSRLGSAIGFEPFSEPVNDLYAHLNCGTYSDLVDPTGGFTRRNRERASNPDSTRGLWREQRAYFESRSW